jgi:P27 family predicted phage terminase small subunit
VTEVRGRKPIPTDIHKLMGTFNATRQGRDRKGEPRPEHDLSYDPPDTLTPSQAAIWRHAVEFAPKGVLKEIDRSVFLVWVVAFDQHETARAAQARIDVRGGEMPFLMKTKNGETMVSPYLGIMNRSGLRMMKAAAELGFSPSSRPRVGGGRETEEVAEGWSRLRVIDGGHE